MDAAGSALGGDIVGADDEAVDVEEWMACGHILELASGHDGDRLIFRNPSGGHSLSGKRRSDDEEIAVLRLQYRIVDVGIEGDRAVARKRPGSRRPDDEICPRRIGDAGQFSLFVVL